MIALLLLPWALVIVLMVLNLLGVDERLLTSARLRPRAPKEDTR